MAFTYPLLLDVSNRLVIVIGGGAVAVRKCEGLIAAGARRIRVIAPVMRDDLNAGVERVIEAYRADLLIGASLVFAATDLPAVNDTVVQDANRLGVLVSRVDSSDTDAGDFSTPAVHRTGAVTISVSTGGSPALAARLRDEIVARLDSSAMAMAEALQRLRPIILAEPALSSDARRDLLRRLAGDEAIGVLRDGGTAALARWVQQSIESSVPQPNGAHV